MRDKAFSYEGVHPAAVYACLQPTRHVGKIKVAPTTRPAQFVRLMLRACDMSYNVFTFVYITQYGSTVYIGMALVLPAL